jgi:hypothetical protein
VSREPVSAVVVPNGSIKWSPGAGKPCVATREGWVMALTLDELKRLLMAQAMENPEVLGWFA